MNKDDEEIRNTTGSLVLTEPKCTEGTATGEYLCLLQAWKEQVWDHRLLKTRAIHGWCPTCALGL